MTFSNRLSPHYLWLFELQFFIFPPKRKSLGRFFKKEIIQLLTKVTRYYLYELNWNSFSWKTFHSFTVKFGFECRLLLVSTFKVWKKKHKNLSYQEKYFTKSILTLTLYKKKSWFRVIFAFKIVTRDSRIVWYSDTFAKNWWKCALVFLSARGIARAFLHFTKVAAALLPVF